MITRDLKIIKKLCKGCGVCAGVCPQEAIIISRDKRLGRYAPAIDKTKCTQCLLCQQSCPALGASVVDISYQHLSDHSLGSFAGYSMNEEIRSGASSGGIVTSLLLSALENKVIDSVLIVESKDGNPFQPRFIVARDRQKIMESMGSVYMPVELSAALKQIIQDDTIKHVGIVGLPCQIEGIKKASALMPDLSKKIAFTIGLFCKQTKDLGFTQLILMKMKIREADVQWIKFRGEGWPGNIQIKKKDGKIYRIPFLAFSRLWSIFSCTPSHCLPCSSLLAESADISVGDAWDEYGRDKKGTSLFIARSQAGTTLIEQAMQNEQIYAEKVPVGRIVNAQSLKTANLKRKAWAFGMRRLTSSYFFKKIFLITLLSRKKYDQANL